MSRSPRTTRPIVLVDADVLVYQAAAGAQKTHVWNEDLVIPSCSLADARAAFYDKLHAVLLALDASDYRLCFSDAIQANFRRLLYDPYKRNREGKVRPLALGPLRDAVIQDFDPEKVFLRPSLEADDCLGILATCKSPHRRIIATVDKDLRSVPGLFYDIGHPEEGVREISLQEADRWHMTQTLIGDKADNYPGCPGIGPKKAAALLDGMETVTAMWPVVVGAFVRAGLTEADALTQARVARILRNTDFDRKTRKVSLWTP